MAKQQYSLTRRRRSRCASSSRARSALSFERTILDALTASIAVINRSGTIIAVNAAWEQFARMNGDPTLAHTGVGVNYLDVCRRAQGADEASQVLAGLEAVLAGTLARFTLEYPCHSPTEQRWFLLHASRLRTSGDGAVVSHTDITQRKLAEEQRTLLLEWEQRARAAAEEAIQHVMRLQQVTAALGAALTPDDVAHIILSQGIAALGAMAGSVVVRTEDGTMLEVLHAVGYPVDLVQQWRRFPLDATTPLSDAVRTGQPVLLASRTAGVERYPALAMLASIFGDGAITAFPLGVHNEVIGGLGMHFQHARTFATEEVAFMLSLVQQCAQALERARLYRSEQQAHAEAEEAVRIRDAFLSIAAHELKNPLTTLLGYAQLLARRAARERTLPERDQHVLSSVIDQATRLSAMVGALLDVSYLESGQLHIECSPLDITALTRGVIAEIEPTLSAHRLVYLAPDEPLMVSGDELRLMQVIQNLIGNAIKYSPNGGVITVEIGVRDRRVCVSVSDQGIGIPPDALPNLFRRFYRAPNVERQHIRGIGVGLYVVKEIVTLHGGEVEVVSAEGQGSTFTVCLPLLDQADVRP